MVERRGPWEGGKDWMARSWGELAQRAIVDVVLPGSHDSATSDLSRDVANDDGGAQIARLRRSPAPTVLFRRQTRPTVFSDARLVSGRIFGAHLTDSVAYRWSACQPLSVPEQLELGVRYLDLRIGRDSSRELPASLRCCHGFFGERIERILQHVRDFCAENGREYVIVDICHLYLKDEAGEGEDTAHRALLSVLVPIFKSRRAVIYPAGQKVKPNETLGRSKLLGIS